MFVIYCRATLTKLTDTLTANVATCWKPVTSGRIKAAIITAMSASSCRKSAKFLRAISENELAQAVDQMREALTGLRVHPTIAEWDSHSTEFGRMISPSNSRQPRHGRSAVQASPYYLPAGDSGSILPADTSEDYRRRSEWQNGLDAGSAYVEQDLDSAHRFFERGKEADQRGDINQAIANYTRAITLHPQYADAYYNRGLAYDDKGEYDLAVADFDAALHINPQHVDAYRKPGRCLCPSG